MRKAIQFVIRWCFSITVLILLPAVCPAVGLSGGVVFCPLSTELPDGEKYAVVSLSYIYDGGKRGVRITVTAKTGILAPCGNFGIQRFGFNTTLANRPDTCPKGDADGDGIDDCLDNCPDHPNGPGGGTCTKGTIGAACMISSDCGKGGFCSRAQEDTCPPAGNKYGNACECEGNFDRDQDVDGTDALFFKDEFGRDSIRNPCTDDAPCYADFDTDTDVDGTDALKFKEDFGRGPHNNICPDFWANVRMALPPEWAGSFGSYQYSEFGRFQIDTRGNGSNRVNPLVIDMYHLTENLLYTDFLVANQNGRFFSVHIADFSYQGSKCMSGYFAGPGIPPTTTTSCAITTSTTSCKPSSTTTSKPTSTTTSKPSSTTSTVATTTTSGLTTTSLLPSSTTTVQPFTTTSTVPTTTTSVPTTTTSALPVTTSTVPVTTSQPSTTSVPLTTTTSVNSICRGEIYKGGICELGQPIDDPAYNRPGRRGLALTCEDVVDFCICTDCVNLDPACLNWTIDPFDPYLSILKTSGYGARLTVGDSCGQLESIREYTVTVTDSCNGWSDNVVVELGKVTIDVIDVSVQKGSESFEVPVSLVNPDHSVKAISVDICECDGGNDRMVCDSCTIDPDRALNFNCSAHELTNGCCRVVIYSTNPADLIFQGDGAICNVIYEATEAFDGCSCLRPVNRQVSDRFNDVLCACQSPGEVCFKSCGDIYPQDCLDPGCASCGDNVVNLFDILEAVDIILGYQTPTACQLDHGDVPNGLPPYCGDPAGALNCLSDGDIDVLDAMIIIDMAQGRANCCDYCLFKRIF